MSHDALGSNVSLCDALDRLLTKGVVANGDILISVAGVDLLYIGLRGLICAVDPLEQPPASLQSQPSARHQAADGRPSAHSERP